jgi:large subunit ribosomal protein L35
MEMPKLKSKSSAKKRFSVTGRGKLRRRTAYHRHNLTKRAKKVKRNQRKSRVLGASDATIVRPFLPYL